MFEIIRYDRPEVHLYEYVIKGNFSIPVKTFSPVNHLEAFAITFKTEHFEFQDKVAISYELAHEVNLPSLIGRQLRGQFIGHFGSQKSSDALEAALKYMASVMHDDGFTCGLLHGNVLQAGDDAAKKKSYYEEATKWKLQAAAYSNPTGFEIAFGGPVGSAFSSKAINFSRKEIFLQKVKHPVVGGTYPLRKVIMSLNDHHGWTREQIADWLETLDININMQPKEEANV